MVVLIKIAQLLLSLSILVLVHEFGHFIAAKIFKVRVEKFYIFFNPWFTPFKRLVGETEYGIGWLPLGGYVKLSGMIDESLDTDQMKSEPKSYEFRTKPAWQRFIIMVAGVIMNIILAIVIYIVAMWVWGEQYLHNSEVKYGISVDSIGYEMGLRNGDKIISVDNIIYEDFYEIPAAIILENAETIQVERDGKNENIVIPDGYISKIIKSKSGSFITPRIPFIIGGFTEVSAARDAGMQVGDKIISIDGKPVYFDEFREEVKNYKSATTPITLVRDSDTLTLMVNISDEGMIGAAVQSPLSIFNITNKDYSLIEAIPAGTKKTFTVVNDYFKQLKLIFSPEVKAYESVGGFITIGKIFPDTWNWRAFWSLTAFLSVVLAILNILPIPGLDGGHALFALFEIVTGRRPGDRFLINAQVVGMIILFALIIFANGNDIVQLLSGK
ncbi:MAG: RIP metalloprotease RseP [Lentimicrobiaceae bacterium]|nr:RIP metalloprotease RseP [Lentimicrobiaceae bacterium]